MKEKMTESNKNGSLRAMKYARTKIAVMNAFIARLREKSFDDISIQEICREAEISEGTFFNYFPAKIDIIYYYSFMMFLKIEWCACQEIPEGKYLSRINTAFEKLAEEMNSPNMLYQLVALMITQKNRPSKISISSIERELVFPNCNGINDMPLLFIDEFLNEQLNEALANKELPKNIEIEDMQISLISILGGTLLATKFGNIINIKYHYMRQLHLFWKSLGITVKK
ncbi:MAG TPA: TetR/AcrR family transcriptional regulator [Candidatus Omnitrophota bacterium]|nr:TetR/AcrR family transcriptional regulator [Candidatus Omnitrophota bacterium]HPS19802.1 TetR/AcrR family transcriptional regulator [Candidatus Omnitrophota bacterium]